MTYSLKDIERNVLNVLSEEEEIHGYDLWKRLSSKGIKCHSNHLYIILKEMEEKGLLKGRWEENGKNINGGRRHLYSMGREGTEALNSSLMESLSLLMTSYVNYMRHKEDFTGFGKVVIDAFTQLDSPLPKEGEIVVLALSYHDPLTCYQLIFSLTDLFPRNAIYVVTPPGMEIFERRRNMTVLQGWRYDIPLKDGFTDYVIIEGFPSQVSEDETIDEAMRILRSGGKFVAQVKNTMVKEKRPEYPFFSEYVEELYYQLFKQDSEISVENIEKILTKYSRNQKSTDMMGTTVFYCEKDVLGT